VECEQGGMALRWDNGGDRVWMEKRGRGRGGESRVATNEEDGAGWWQGNNKGDQREAVNEGDVASRATTRGGQRAATNEGDSPRQGQQQGGRRAATNEGDSSRQANNQGGTERWLRIRRVMVPRGRRHDMGQCWRGWSSMITPWDMVGWQ